jgi:hypothetical protein
VSIDKDTGSPALKFAEQQLVNVRRQDLSLALWAVISKDGYKAVNEVLRGLDIEPTPTLED